MIIFQSGRSSGCCLTSGTNNILFGLSAGKKITTADNIMIGRAVAANPQATACSNIVMGLESGRNMGTPVTML